MTSWRIVLEYDGTGYVGWQRQPVGVSVQEVVEVALRQVLGGEPVVLTGSGRTDSGVHALGQVASFVSHTPRSPHHIRMGLNSLLPPDVACRSAEVVLDGFHARRSARRKTYLYRILDTGERSPLRARQTWHLRGPLDVEAMRTAARSFVGTHDFTSFRGGGSSVKTTVRTLHAVDVERHGDEVHVQVTGNGFLRYMVRILVGTLVDVGRGRRRPDSMPDVLAALNRKAAGRTAPAQGLCLVRVVYEAGSPDSGDGPDDEE